MGTPGHEARDLGVLAPSREDDGPVFEVTPVDSFALPYQAPIVPFGGGCMIEARIPSEGNGDVDKQRASPME